MRTTAIILSIVIILILLLVAFLTSILRESNKPGAPYSFSRFQLWLWTAVISPCFILYWGYLPDNNPELNETALILLGISGTVTVFSWVVTSIRAAQQLKNKTINLKVNQPSRNFWLDLLMDSNGDYSVTRLQQLLFTLIYSVFYIALFYQDKILPDFDETAFILMGISSGGYLIGKSVE